MAMHGPCPGVTLRGRCGLRLAGDVAAEIR